VGLTCNTTCLDCGEAAPEVGDCGYIGYPSASRELGPGGRPPNFGYLYEGFAAIRLVTHDLDSLDSFLRAHEGHRLQTFADGEPAFGDGGDDAEDLSDMDEGEDEDDDWSEEDAAKYPVAHYRVQCKACGASFMAEAPDNIKAFAPTPLTSDDIERFLARVAKNLDPETIYRAEPLSPDDLNAVVAFLHKHRDHAVEAAAVQGVE
jgi:hypothetical protein